MKKTLRSATLVAGSIIVSLLVGELALQGHYRLTAGTWLISEQRAYKVTCISPVGDDREYALRPGFHSDLVNIDDDGFRRQPGTSPSPGTPVVAVLGDSVPFGMGVGDSDTYPALLESCLGPTGLKVVNAGVPSYTIHQSIRRLYQDVLPLFKPRVVILQAANDVSLFALHGANWQPTFTWAQNRFGKELPPSLVSSSAIVHYARIASANWRKFGARHQTWDSARQRMLSNLTDDLRLLRGDASLSNVPIVLLPIDPFYFQKDRGRSQKLKAWKKYEHVTLPWWDLVQGVNATLQATANPLQGLYWFDTRPLMDATGREGQYLDWIHLDRAGATLVASQLSRFIRDHHWVP